MKGRPPVLTKEEVDLILYLYRTTAHNLSTLAKLFRVSVPTITRAVEGKAKVKP